MHCYEGIISPKRDRAAGAASTLRELEASDPFLAPRWNLLYFMVVQAGQASQWDLSGTHTPLDARNTTCVLGTVLIVSRLVFSIRTWLELLGESTGVFCRSRDAGNSEFSVA